MNNKDLFWPYLGTLEYDADLISDSNHGLLRGTELMHWAQVFLDERIRVTTARWKGIFFFFLFRHDEAEKDILCLAGLHPCRMRPSYD
jgi:hypothetical protein